MNIDQSLLQAILYLLISLIFAFVYRSQSKRINDLENELIRLVEALKLQNFGIIKGMIESIKEDVEKVKSNR